MPLGLILIGAILIVVAFQNTMGQLATELQADLPGFFVWLLAIAAILGLGYVPGMKVPSRWLLGLVALVILLTNYKKIFEGFTTFASTGAAATATGATAADPATTFASSPKGPLPTPAQVAGDPASAAPAAASTPTGNPITNTLQQLNSSSFGGMFNSVTDALDSLDRSLGFGGSR